MGVVPQSAVIFILLTLMTQAAMRMENFCIGRASQRIWDSHILILDMTLVQISYEQRTPQSAWFLLLQNIEIFIQPERHPERILLDQSSVVSRNSL